MAQYPYNGDSGWSGSEASQERAESRDASGRTANDQRTTLAWLTTRGTHGGTQAELQKRLGVGHGTASGVLSNLHQAGLVERLMEKRMRNHVYIRPEFVVGRELSDYRRLQSREVLRQRIADLEAALESAVEVIRPEEHAHPSLATLRLYLANVLNDRIEP